MKILVSPNQYQVVTVIFSFCFGILLSLFVVAEAGYRRFSRSDAADGGSCHQDLTKLSEKEIDEIFAKLLREMGDENNDITSKDSTVTKAQRRELLVKCIKEIDDVEKDDSKAFSLKLSKFCLMTDDELMAKTGLVMSEKDKQLEHEINEMYKRQGKRAAATGTPPKSVDNCAATGPVEDQGWCGSCWAFAASHVMTGWLRYRDQSNKTIRLSEQQLVDCSYDHHSGCEGGVLTDGFKMFANYKAATDFKMPYTAVYNGKSACSNSDGRVDLHLIPNTQFGYVHQDLYVNFVQVGNVNEMKLAVAKGPLYVAMYVSGKYNWGKNADGVYQANASCAANAANHAMLICGYGHDEKSGLDYWIVKNSWGTHFGENGYVKVEMGKNVCNIETHSFYPNLDMTKKTDVSNLCVPEASCSSDADCNGVKDACEGGKCKCRQCISNIVCQTDKDCGGKTDSCVIRSQSWGHCSCSNECNEAKPCTSDAGCGSQEGACAPKSKSAYHCRCAKECSPGASCEADKHCGGIPHSCRKTGSWWTMNDGTKKPMQRCNCATTCQEGASCESDGECAGKANACTIKGHSPNAVCRCSGQCVDDQQCSSSKHCAGKPCLATGRKYGDEAIFKCECAKECQEAKTCTTDAGCGSQKGACAPKGKSAYHCRCAKECSPGAKCEADKHCGGIPHSCRKTGRWYTMNDGTKKPIQECNCVTTCQEGASCESDKHCAGKPCLATGKKYGDGQEIFKCECVKPCQEGASCQSDGECAGKANACTIKGHSPNAVCRCSGQCVENQQCSSSKHCAGKPCLATGRKYDDGEEIFECKCTCKNALSDADCERYKGRGSCKLSNPSIGFMQRACKKSCGFC